MARKRLAVDDRPLFIIGVDPGKATGISVYTGGKLIHHDTVPADEVYETIALRTLPALHGLRVVIGVERYTYGINATKKSRQTDAMEIMGQLEGAAKIYHAEFRLINQSDTKKLASNTTLKSIGWWVHDPEGHTNDASRVALTTLAQVRPTEFAKLIYGVVE